MQPTAPSLLDMNSRSATCEAQETYKSHTTLNYTHFPGRGLCVAMLDIVCAVTGKTRLDAQKWAFNMMKGSEAAEFAELVGEKVSGVPSFSGPTWVLSYEGCIELISFLQRKSTKGYTKFINRQFTRLRAGD
eukprot:3514720-Rhodomonas_salina.1